MIFSISDTHHKYENIKINFKIKMYPIHVSEVKAETFRKKNFNFGIRQIIKNDTKGTVDKILTNEILS